MGKGVLWLPRAERALIAARSFWFFEIPGKNSARGIRGEARTRAACGAVVVKRGESNQKGLSAVFVILHCPFMPYIVRTCSILQGS